MIFYFYLSARPGSKLSSSIFLYILVISEGFQTPVYSMLSEAQNANAINFWLNEWIRLGGMTPNEFVCDMSLALLNTAVRAFAKEWTIRDYVDHLFILTNDLESGSPSNLKIPNCFIRIDIAHLMKNVASHKTLENKPIKARDFFIRCVGILVKMETIAEAKDHIKGVLIVANSETEGL